MEITSVGENLPFSNLLHTIAVFYTRQAIILLVQHKHPLLLAIKLD